MRKSQVVATALLLLLSACGADPSGEPGAVTTTIPETTTTTSGPTTTTLPETTSTSSTTTTTIGATTTTAPGATTTTSRPAGSTISVAPWFYVDEAGHPSRTGPFLLPVNREIPRTVAVGRASLEQLFAGPSQGETTGTPAITTTIPAGVRVLGLTISEGIAIVDLSAEFEGDDDSPVVAQRMAQVVFTLTSIPHVNEVLFRQEGSAIRAQRGDGQLVDRPVLKADYLDMAAAITVEQPVLGGQGSSPLRVSGFAAVFEAVFNYALTDGNGLIIAEGNAMTTNGTGWGGFDFAIPYEVDREQTGALIVWTHSAADGSQIDIREYPVRLAP